MNNDRKITTSNRYSVQNSELYCAYWSDGSCTWVEARSVKQARLLHTLIQHEQPVDVERETSNGYW